MRWQSITIIWKIVINYNQLWLQIMIIPCVTIPCKQLSKLEAAKSGDNNKRVTLSSIISGSILFWVFCCWPVQTTRAKGEHRLNQVSTLRELQSIHVKGRHAHIHKILRFILLCVCVNKFQGYHLSIEAIVSPGEVQGDKWFNDEVMASVLVVSTSREGDGVQSWPQQV